MEHPRGLHFTISPVDAGTVRPLRRELLRPGASDAELVYPHDDDDDTVHLGTYTFDVLCGIATAHRQAPPWQDDHPAAWRLRGMATSAGVRRRGVGRWMLAGCMQHAWEHGGTLMWCNARAGAIDFYRVLGFEPFGERFVIDGIGEHVQMYRELAVDG